MGWKWSKPQTPSKPRPSAKRVRSTTSAKGMRCAATSNPIRMLRTLCVRGRDRAELGVLGAERAPRGLPPGDDPRVHHPCGGAVGLDAAARRALRGSELRAADHDAVDAHAQP